MITAATPSHAETMQFLGSLQDDARRPVPADTMSVGEWSDWMRGSGSHFFKGAEYSGAAEKWSPGEYAPNTAWEADAAALRYRAWNLYNNNPFCQSLVDTLIQNAVETGLWPKRDDDQWNRGVRRWAGVDGWSMRDCDLSRDSTFPELQAIWLREVVLSGGCISNFVYLKPKTQRVPMSIELIGEERLADTLSHYGTNPKTRNVVIGGVEIEQGTGRDVAYHVYPASDLDHEVDMAGDPIRLSVENAEYAFLKRKTNEKRGTTSLRTAILWAHSLGYYFDREMFNANLKSQWAYVIERDPKYCPRDEANELSAEVDLQDAAGNKVRSMAAARVYNATNGGTIKAVGPNVPGSDSVPWLRLMEEAIALSLSQSFAATYRNTTDASMGTLRYTHNADKRTWKIAQNFCLQHFVAPATRRFESQAVIAGIPGFLSPAAYLQQQDDLLETQEWIRPGWESFTPLEDARANDLNLRNGSDNVEDISARLGADGNLKLKKAAAEQKFRAENNLALQAAGSAGPGTLSGQGNDE